MGSGSLFQQDEIKFFPRHDQPFATLDIGRRGLWGEMFLESGKSGQPDCHLHGFSRGHNRMTWWGRQERLAGWRVSFSLGWKASLLLATEDK